MFLNSITITHSSLSWNYTYCFHIYCYFRNFSTRKDLAAVCLPRVSVVVYKLRHQKKIGIIIVFKCFNILAKKNVDHFFYFQKCSNVHERCGALSQLRICRPSSLPLRSGHLDIKDTPKRMMGVKFHIAFGRPKIQLSSKVG